MSIPNTLSSRSPLRQAASGTLCCALILGAAASTAAERDDGVAYDRAGRVAYRETHWRYAEGDTHRRLVLYRCADGRPFARKHMHWQQANEAAPDFDFLDQRDGYREGLAGAAGGREVYWQPSRSAEERRALVRLGPDAVVDAGFDSFIRRRWDELATGEVLRTAFLLPADLAAIPVAIRRVPGAQPEPDAAVARFTVELDRWYAFVAPTLTLAYAASTRRLREFQGAVTIRDEQGKRQKLRVAFPAAPSAASAGDIAAAAAEPLVARCEEP